MVIQKPGFVEILVSDRPVRETAAENVIEEVEARFEYSPRWKVVLGVIPLIPPISVLGMGFFAYESYNAGERLRGDESKTPAAAEPESAPE